MIIPFVTIFIILILIVTILIEIILINIILIIKILVIISTFAIIRYLPHLQADNEVFELRISKPAKGTSLSVHCHYNLHRS